MMETRFYRLVDIIGDRKREIPAIIPVSARTWFRGVADGRFPKPIKLTLTRSGGYQQTSSGLWTDLWLRPSKSIVKQKAQA